MSMLVVGKVIPITDPTHPTPEGYVRVTFDQGANGTFAADAKTMFDVKSWDGNDRSTSPDCNASS